MAQKHLAGQQKLNSDMQITIAFASSATAVNSPVYVGTGFLLNFEICRSIHPFLFIPSGGNE
jgi:hypothetical protein